MPSECIWNYLLSSTLKSGICMSQNMHILDLIKLGQTALYNMYGRWFQIYMILVFWINLYELCSPWDTLWLILKLALICKPLDWIFLFSQSFYIIVNYVISKQNTARLKIQAESNKDLLRSTGNYIQYFVIMYHGKESGKEYI